MIMLNRVVNSFQNLSLADLLDKLLVLNPKQRLTALEALDHDWFWTEPLPVDPAQYVTSQDLLY